MQTRQLFYFFVSIVGCESARILGFFPTPAFSHQVVFRPVTQELARRGHQVIVYTPSPAFPDGGAPANLTEVSLAEVNDQLRATFYSELSAAKDFVSTQITSAKLVGRLFGMYTKMEPIRSLVKGEQKFDLILLEALVRPGLVLSHIFKAPVVQFSSFGFVKDMIEEIGAATHPILYPTDTRKKFQNLSLWEKISAYVSYYQIKRAYADIDEKQNQLLKDLFGADTPELAELAKNVALAFLNVHPIWDYNRPVPPNVIYIGGLCQTPTGHLPQDIQSFLDASKNGVIYVSFGTNVHPGVITVHTIRMMVNTFAKLPYDFLMKYDDETIVGSSKNIKVFSWSSQPDILMHANTKLFITQGGLQSTYESIAAGVPLVGIPLVWDQFLNVDKYTRFGIGLQLDIQTLDENVLKQAIREVMGNESYRESTVRLRELMLDRPSSSVDAAVWWTEYALRHGPAVGLRAAAAGVHWFQYYETKLILLLVFMATASVSCFIFTALLVLRLLNKKTKRD